MANKDDILTDDYVADLLAKDAADCDLKYSAMGMEAFRSTKKPSNKPKPNTRFLKHIIKDTDTHNRALLAKESAESRARLEGLEQAEEAKRLRTNPNVRDIRKRQLGDIHAILGGSGRRSRRRDDDEDRATRTGRSEGSSATSKDRRGRLSTSSTQDDLIRPHGREDRKRHGRLADESGSSHKHRERYSRRRGSESERDERSSTHRRSHHDRHRSRSPTRSRRHDHHSSKSSNSKQAGYRDRSPASRRQEERTDKQSKRSPSPLRRRRRSPSSTPEIDTDGSDDEMGPRPAPKPRGRGALTGSSGIDRRFSDSYDPRTDVQMDEDADEDTGNSMGQPWDDAVEAFRDRQKLKQSQEARLRSAGFAESHIQHIQSTTQGAEKSEADVQWAKAGEKREWDKGKESSGEEEDLSTLLVGDM